MINAMKEKRRLWEKEEFVLVLSLYFQLKFGQLSSTNKKVRYYASLIGRTSSSVAMRLTNFAACDPYILATGRHGLEAGRKQCQPYWEEYVNDKERLFLEAEVIKARLQSKTVECILGISDSDFVGTTRAAVVQQRVNQNVFRSMILNNYNNKCAITGIDIPELLVASHIVPWAADEKNRLNPENGICLSPLYDKVFDKGLITISPDYEILLSEELKSHSGSSYFEKQFGCIDHHRISLPEEHSPKREFLEYHRDNLFSQHN
ncbi:MAG: HNH endonuclease [Lachnospiraceae bacterium]|nr:HNH endonuclease [Lachnospiraceae bacterium]